ncbi:hypothetical protein M8J77_009180 [Diaphorina citri]|nr:hypothetical protein M8J77_009180 [Diaphorina citri]
MTDMDHQQLMDLIAREIDRRTSQLMNENIRLQQQCETEKVLKQQVINIPCPSPLDLSGNVRDNIQFFTRMWKEYLVASGTEKEPEKKKVALLMNVIGCEAAKIVFKIVNIEEEGITTDKVLEALKKKMSPEINVRYERFVFNSMKQEEEEDYQTYFMRLNDQIKLCEYKAMEEEIMIDKIICSIKNMKMKEKLWLRENLKLTDVVQMCKADEESKKQLENMSGKANDINKIKSTTLPASATSKKCPYCGGQWHSSLLKCPAKNKTCFKCNKKGHFSHVCRGEAVLKEVTRASASENDNDVLKIEKSGTNGVYSNLNFVLGNSKVKSVRCQLDTGASCNVIGHNQLKQILGKANFSWRDKTFIPIQSLTNLWMYSTALAE